MWQIVSVSSVSVGGGMDAAHGRVFEEFVQDQMMALFGTAYLLVGNVHQAEDLLQSALEKAFRRWRRVEAMEYPEAYVRRIIVNLATDRWRWRGRVAEVALDETMVVPRPDDTALVDLRLALMAGLYQLPVGMRAVLVLRYWEGMSDAEVADVIGRSVGTVKSQASRGLQRLREMATSRHGLAEALR
jgi:RNA polymerase sigma-70 factor (sigma-E family)